MEVLFCCGLSLFLSIKLFCKFSSLFLTYALDNMLSNSSTFFKIKFVLYFYVSKHPRVPGISDAGNECATS